MLLAGNQVRIIIAWASSRPAFLRVNERSETEAVLRLLDYFGRDIIILWTWLHQWASFWMFLVSIDGPLFGCILLCGVEVGGFELSWARNFGQHFRVHEFSFCQGG